RGPGTQRQHPAQPDEEVRDLPLRSVGGDGSYRHAERGGPQRTYQSGPSTSPPPGVRAACQLATPPPGLPVAPRAAAPDPAPTPPSARATWMATLSGDEAPAGLHSATRAPSWGGAGTASRAATVPGFLPTAVRSTTMGQALNAAGGPDPHSISRSVNRT